MELKIKATLRLAAFSVVGYIWLFKVYGNDWLGPMGKQCFVSSPQPSEPVKFPVTGNSIWDLLSCVGSAFFEPVIENPAGLLVARNFVAMCFPVYLVMAMESQRLRASGVMTWYPIIAAATLIVCFGVIYPLFWVIGYWWMPKKQPTQIGATKVQAIFVAMLIIACFLVPLVIPQIALPTTKWMTPLILAPAAVAILFYAAPQGGITSATAVKAVSAKALLDPRVLIFMFFTGASMVVHFWAVAEYATTEGATMLPMILNAGLEWRPEHFVWFDSYMSVVSTGVFILHSNDVPCGGVKATWQYVAQSLVIGPGAAFGYFLTKREAYYIEQELARASGAVGSGVKAE